MPAPTPITPTPTSNHKAAESHFYRWEASFIHTDPHLQMISNKTAYLVGFRDGAKYNFRESASLSPHIARFIEYVLWLDPYEPIDFADSANAHPNCEACKAIKIVSDAYSDKHDHLRSDGDDNK